MGEERKLEVEGEAGSILGGATVQENDAWGVYNTGVILWETPDRVILGPPARITPRYPHQTRGHHRGKPTCQSQRAQLRDRAGGRRLGEQTGVVYLLECLRAVIYFTGSLGGEKN